MKILPVVKTDNNMLPLAERCKASWDYFHPDIPMHIVKLEDWKDYIAELGQTPAYLEHSMVVGLFYAIQKMIVEKYDLFIYIDADTVVTGRCEEMFTNDYDIAVSQMAGYADQYNAGIWASKDLEFIKSFYYTHLKSPIPDNHLFMDIFNCFKPYKIIKILDNDDTGVWYNERSREWWNRLSLKDNELRTPDRKIKILHWAAGSYANPNSRFSCSLFSDEVKQWLNKITGGTTFTDYDGKEFGDFIKRTYGL
jgi:hypothetical protein